MAKFVVIVDVEDPRRHIRTERQKYDIMIGLRDMLMSTPFVGVSGDEYEVNNITDIYFPF